MLQGEHCGLGEVSSGSYGCAWCMLQSKHCGLGEVSSGSYGCAWCMLQSKHCGLVRSVVVAMVVPSACSKVSIVGW